MKRMKYVLMVVASMAVSGAFAQLDVRKMDGDQLVAAAKKEMAAGHYRSALTLTHIAIRKNKRDLDVRFLLGRLYELNNYPDSAEDVLKDVIYQDPKYRDAYASLASIEMGKHDPEEALCYIDDGLYYYPADKEFELRKFGILQMLQKPAEADQQGDLLLNRYRGDTSVLRTYINYKIESAQRYTRLRDYDRARYEYRQVLTVEPGNSEAREGIYNTLLKAGGYEDALATVNSALNDHPDDYTLLFKKESLLQDLHRYPEAIEVLQHLLRIYPGDAKAHQLDVDLRMEAGRYFMSEDPYLQFQAVLEKSPSNREALNYVINLASARGLNKDALAFVNKALRYYPTDRDLLAKKMSILENLQKYTEASEIAQVLGKNSSDYIELKEASGKYYMGQFMYDSALAEFHDVLNVNPAEPAALNYSINIFAAQKNYDAAIALLDKALQYYPNDENLLLKKAGILQDDTRYPDAAAVLEQLMRAHPDNKHYQSSYVDLSLAMGRQMMQAQDYDAAYGTFAGVLQQQPDNTEALETVINIEIARGAPDSALVVADQALNYYPGSRDFLLKKAAALEALQRYPEAYVITGELMRRYPYNTKVRDQYVDELLASGQQYNRRGQSDSALAEFEKVLVVRPRDSAALSYAINILNTLGSDSKARKAFHTGVDSTVLLDSALVLIDRGLRYYPGNEYFTLKRAVVLENLGRFTEALPAADSVVKMDPTDGHKDYADYLRSKTYRNAIGLSYLTAHFDSLAPANFATLHYVHYTRNGSSFDTKLNFAGRATGTGLQLEEEIYYTHNQKWSSYGDIAIANQSVFPRIHLAYSISRNFSGGWSGELGFRYLNLDSISVTSAVGAIGKYFGDFYLNARGYLIFAPGKMYEAGVLTARQYLDNKTDYLYGSIGVGDSPDEFTRDYQLNNLLGSQTYSIGAGYQKVFRYRNVLNLSGTWYNQKLAENRYRNEYDISLSYLRKF